MKSSTRWCWLATGADGLGDWTKPVRPARSCDVARPRDAAGEMGRVGGYSPSTIAGRLRGWCALRILRGRTSRLRMPSAIEGPRMDWEGALFEIWMVTQHGRTWAKARGTGYTLHRQKTTDRPMDSSWTRAMLRSLGTSAKWGAGFWNLCGGIRPASAVWVFFFLFWYDHSALVAIGEGAIRVETPNGRRFYRYSHEVYGEKVILADRGRGKARAQLAEFYGRARRV